MQTLAGQIQAHRRLLMPQMDVDAQLRAHSRHRRTLAVARAQPVDDRVLDLERPKWLCVMACELPTKSTARVPSGAR